jgi:hypothetical protein
VRGKLRFLIGFYSGVTVALAAQVAMFVIAVKLRRIAQQSACAAGGYIFTLRREI